MTFFDEIIDKDRHPPFNEAKLVVDEKCEECVRKYINPLPNEMLIYLHAMRYKVIMFNEIYFFQLTLSFRAKAGNMKLNYHFGRSKKEMRLKNLLQLKEHKINHDSIESSK